ncbi:DUF455 family protein [Xanthomonas cerealis]|uniref:DUF455 family protein n=1 Tax=Xanthomonas cerealis TaxID=3390025 RepID=UPI000A6A1FAD|nr:DUF455 family protein [Xanthomonas translucens]UKE47458.1 DUF455 family protein [Xanthomonas translucens pv. cerealis]
MANSTVAQKSLRDFAFALRYSMMCLAADCFCSSEAKRKVELAFALKRIGLALRGIVQRLEEYWHPDMLNKDVEAFDLHEGEAPSVCSYERKPVSARVKELDCFASFLIGRLPRNLLHEYDKAILERARRDVLSAAADNFQEVEICKADFFMVNKISELRNTNFHSIIPERPVRPMGWERLDQRINWGRSAEETILKESNFQAFLEYVYADVEITAVDICCHSLLQGGSLPHEFCCDISRQIGDEARHAESIANMIRKLGGDETKSRYVDIVADRYYLGDSLLEKLAIQHLVQEGNAVEVNSLFISDLRSVGYHEIADEFEVITRDEALHVKIGNRWVLHLLAAAGADGGAYTRLLRDVGEKISLSPYGKGSWDSNVRRSVDFPEAFIQSAPKEPAKSA